MEASAQKRGIREAWIRRVRTTSFVVRIIRSALPFCGEVHGVDVVVVDEHALGERAVELRQELSEPGPLNTTLFSVPLLVTTTFGSSGVRVTLTPPPPLLTSWRPARLVVCSLGTPLTTRGTDALTSPLGAF